MNALQYAESISGWENAEDHGQFFMNDGALLPTHEEGSRLRSLSLKGIAVRLLNLKVSGLQAIIRAKG
jgi:hypothetical protein